jgi:hypothetical protein
MSILPGCARSQQGDSFVACCATGSSWSAKPEPNRQDYHPDGRRVTVSFHGPGETFAPKILRIMIEVQAKWTAEDCQRLSLL